MMGLPASNLILTTFALKTNINKLPQLLAIRHLISVTSIHQTLSPASITKTSSVLKLWHSSTPSVSHSLPVSSPSAMEGAGIGLSQVVQILESFAPTSLAEKWDNVGLLVVPETGTESIISRILLTNDLTEDVLKEAVTGNFNMIISYHPPIFEAMKRVTSLTWKARISFNPMESSAFNLELHLFI